VNIGQLLGSITQEWYDAKKLTKKDTLSCPLLNRINPTAQKHISCDVASGQGWYPKRRVFAVLEKSDSLKLQNSALTLALLRESGFHPLHDCLQIF